MSSTPDASPAKHGHWDVKFLELCEHIACWSKESGKKVGAVIVGPWNEIRSTGFNGFPRGIDDADLSRHDRDTGAKYLWSSHAERNAIFNAARVGIPLFGCGMYSNYFPCIECAKAIIQTGISRLVTRPPDLSDPKWGSEFEFSKMLFNESGVVFSFIEKSAKE
jgi:dCMP deaminase